MKIDYVVVLDPPARSALASAIRAYRTLNPRTRHATPLQLPDDPNTPTAIAIKTKSANADEISGPTQLALWARAHFRFLECLPSATGNLPILPVIYVHGARWRVDFAQRTAEKLVSSLDGPPSTLD